jgi:hypothetical protein
MTNERLKNEETFGDVQWLDEVALHRAIVGGDPEAFAELIRRFDPVVRAHVSRSTVEELVEEEMAEFWIALIRDPRLREWDADQGGLLAPWIGSIAARWCAVNLQVLPRAA